MDDEKGPEALLRKITRLRDLVENMGEGVAIVDGEERILFANPASEDIVGVPWGGLVGRRLEDFTDEDGRRLLREKARLRRQGIRDTFEMGIIRPDGETRTIRFTAIPRHDETGKLVGTFGVFADITEHRRMEERLRESEQRFHSLAMTASDAVIVCNARGIISFWNKSAQDVFGYREEEVLGKSIALLIPEKEHDVYMARLRPRNPQEESPVVGRLTEGYGVRMDGSVFPVEISVASWKMAGETFFTGIIRDITWRRKMDEELRARNEELTAFSHSIAHDLLNPLSLIEGYSQTALRARAEGYGALEETSLESVIKAARRASGFVNSLLQYAEAGRPQGKPERIDLEASVREVLEELGNGIREAGAKVLVHHDLPAVKADPTRLHQVLYNLIANSCKFKREGEALRVEIGATTQPGAITVFVRDNGQGIPAGQHETIFEPFRRAHASDTPGLGIGLSTVKNAVKGWGGEVRVESAPGQGTAFLFTIPPA